MVESQLPMVAISTSYYNPMKPSENLKKNIKRIYTAESTRYRMSNINPLAATGTSAVTSNSSTASPGSCDFTVLVSFDQKKEEITGRGLNVSLDAKVAFDTLKATIGDYLKSVSIGPHMNVAQLENKKRFWKGLREYCQSRVRGSLDGMNVSWAVRIWAGYSLYQVPMNSATDKAFLFKMKTNTISGDTAVAARECTVTHKQLHDMVNKQFRKFTLSVEQEIATLKSAAALHASQQFIDPTNHFYAYIPSAGTSIGTFTQHPSGTVLNHHGLPPIQSGATQHNLSLHMSTINNGNNVTSGNMKLIELQQQIPGYSTAAATQMNIAPSSFVQLPQIHNMNYSDATPHAHVHGHDMSIHKLTRRFSADRLVTNSMGSNLQTQAGLLEKSKSTGSKDVLLPKLQDLNEILANLKQVLNESKHTLKENVRQQMKNELQSIIRNNLSINSTGSKRSRDEMNSNSPVRRNESDLDSDVASIPEIASKRIKWADAEEAIMVGLVMECYLLYGIYDWEKVAYCFQTAWKKYCSENGLKSTPEAKTAALIAQHFKCLKRKMQNNDEKRSLMSFLNTWKDVYNKGNKLIDTKSTYKLHI